MSRARTSDGGGGYGRHAPGAGQPAGVQIVTVPPFTLPMLAVVPAEHCAALPSCS